jgi:hypothetical protein
MQMAKFYEDDIFHSFYCLLIFFDSLEIITFFRCTMYVHMYCSNRSALLLRWIMNNAVELPS